MAHAGYTPVPATHIVPLLPRSPLTVLLDGCGYAMYEVLFPDTNNIRGSSKNTFRAHTASGPMAVDLHYPGWPSARIELLESLQVDATIICYEIDEYDDIHMVYEKLYREAPPGLLYMVSHRTGYYLSVNKTVPGCSLILAEYEITLNHASIVRVLRLIFEDIVHRKYPAPVQTLQECTSDITDKKCIIM